MPPPVLSNQEAMLSQNHSISDPLEVVPGRSFHTFVILKLGCCILIYECFLAYFLMKMKCIFEIVYSAVTLIVIFSLHSKKSLCFLHWISHSFLCLKPLFPFCRYYSLELEIYISFSCVCFGFGLSSLEFEYLSSSMDACCLLISKCFLA